MMLFFKLSLFLLVVYVNCEVSEIPGDDSDEDFSKHVTAAVVNELRRTYIADFEEIARQFVEQKGREYNRKIDWWDLHGKHSHLAERPEYKQYKISVTTDAVNYGVVTRTIDRPGYVYSQWFHNAQSSQPIRGIMSKTVNRASSFTWSLRQGLTIGAEVKVSVALPTPIIIGASVSLSTELSLEASQSSTKSETESYTVENTILVDPNKSVKAEWTLTEREMEVPWEADVFIDGWVAAWFKEKYNNHWLWFFRVNQMANDKFKPTGTGLTFRAKGVFTGVRGLHSTVRTFEYPLVSSYGFSAPLKVSVIDDKDV